MANVFDDDGSYDEPIPVQRRSTKKRRADQVDDGGEDQTPARKRRRVNRPTETGIPTTARRAAVAPPSPPSSRTRSVSTSAVALRGGGAPGAAAVADEDDDCIILLNKNDPFIWAMNIIDSRTDEEAMECYICKESLFDAGFTKSLEEHATFGNFRTILSGFLEDINRNIAIHNRNAESDDQKEPATLEQVVCHVKLCEDIPCATNRILATRLLTGIDRGWLLPAKMGKKIEGIFELTRKEIKHNEERSKK